MGVGICGGKGTEAQKKITRHTHTRTCYPYNRCVSVFDHHCPWINNCVGIVGVVGVVEVVEVVGVT